MVWLPKLIPCRCSNVLEFKKKKKYLVFSPLDNHEKIIWVWFRQNILSWRWCDDKKSSSIIWLWGIFWECTLYYQLCKSGIYQACKAGVWLSLVFPNYVLNSPQSLSFQHFVKRVPLSCLAITNDIPVWPLNCLTVKLSLQIVRFRSWHLLLEICPSFPIFWCWSLLYWFLTCLLYIWQVVPTKPFALIAREERLNSIARRWLVVCMISYFH